MHLDTQLVYQFRLSLVGDIVFILLLNPFFSFSLFFLCLCIYVCAYVCVCVCVREREREQVCV